MAQDKIDLQHLMPEGWEGKFPPCQIQVDAQGKLYGQGRPMVHEGIMRMVYDSVHLDDDGIYYLEIDGKRCQLEVEDTFYVVAGVDLNEEGAMLTLNDGSREPFQADELWIGQDEVLYCRVKDGDFPARFSRQAYYQLAEQVVEGEDGGFALRLGGENHPIESKA